MQTMLPPLPPSPTHSNIGAEPSYAVPSAPPVEAASPPQTTKAPQKIPSKVTRKPGPKPKLTAKEKKARDVCVLAS